ncbi:SRPBCC domain-containing protein [Microbacterium trichothecenolyticum]|uniref:SRPBCC domain-containing protein n=1 Tax=Microbacterium trichothecenolyticum TaxID=69370 RepID=UPI001C6E03AE|nr:SRPBCC domain-containing protein [Microbacterium trichothecenolyticum]MBW9121247.1 SRPBCC domain-containing protein [Microbacterium trichothecenolyticum]
MSSVTGSFTIPLGLDVPPAQLWPLFAELPLRRTWTRMPGPSATALHELDFRVGGTERMTNTFVSGDQREELENVATFVDIVPNERIISTYRAIVDHTTRWVALVTIDLIPTQSGTRLEWTEQYSFVTLSTPDGVDDERHLVGGTRLRLNGLYAAVMGLAAAPPA